MIKSLSAAVLALAFVASAASAQVPPTPGTAPLTPFVQPSAGPMPTPTPINMSTTTPKPTVDASAAAAAAASPAASGLVSFTGQLLDVRGNFAYFTTGDAFPTVIAPRVIDYFTGQPTTVAPSAKMFAKATFDPKTGKIIELAITKRRLQQSKGLGEASAFVVAGSKGETAPELVGQLLTGRQVAVTFEVTVPPTTSLTDQIYISTDSSQWNPTAIKLDRVDAYKYRAQRFFASGTKFSYRVTRGSWNSVERGEDNLDAPPHNFFVREVDALAARVTVYHWSDERGTTNRGAGPDSIPTPFNANPFGGPKFPIPQVPQRPSPRP
jgi:hypothetical protein